MLSTIDYKTRNQSNLFNHHYNKYPSIGFTKFACSPFQRASFTYEAFDHTAIENPSFQPVLEPSKIAKFGIPCCASQYDTNQTCVLMNDLRVLTAKCFYVVAF